MCVLRRECGGRDQAAAVDQIQRPKGLPFADDAPQQRVRRAPGEGFAEQRELILYRAQLQFDPQDLLARVALGANADFVFQLRNAGEQENRRQYGKGEQRRQAEEQPEVGRQPEFAG